jgi:hypothetical protein
MDKSLVKKSIVDGFPPYFFQSIVAFEIAPGVKFFDSFKEEIHDFEKTFFSLISHKIWYRERRKGVKVSDSFNKGRIGRERTPEFPV